MFKNNVKKLSLNKETVRGLSSTEMQGVVGGMLYNRSHGCTCTCKCETITCPKAVALYAF
ncbi:MAG: rSAM-modified peptide [Pirellulales bacterium]|nr:rSAM-modified peptide [Pirellulales bacterium]